VMSEMGKAMMGTGEATGEGRAIEAAQKAIANPLLDEVSMRGAKGVIINITGGDDLKLMEVDEAASYIRDMVDTEANIIVGSAFNKDLDGLMRVSVVATGIDAASRPMPIPVPQKKAAAPAFLSQPSIFTMPPPITQLAPEPEPVAEIAPEPEPAITENAFAPTLDLPVGEEAMARVLDTIEAGPPEAEVDDAMDLAEMGERVETSFTFTPAAPIQPTANPVMNPEPMPAAPAADERPLTLFERMMGMSRKPRPAPEAPATLAPQPEPPQASDDDVPGFMKRQVNR
jgi:cell division protein FtsZ